MMEELVKDKEGGSLDGWLNIIARQDADATTSQPSIIGKTVYRGVDAFVVVAETKWRGGGYLLQLLQPDGMAYSEFKKLSRALSGIYPKWYLDFMFEDNPNKNERDLSIISGLLKTPKDNHPVKLVTVPELKFPGAETLEDFSFVGHIYKRLDLGFGFIITAQSGCNYTAIFDTSDLSVFCDTREQAEDMAKRAIEKSFPGKPYVIRGWGMSENETNTAKQMGATDSPG